MYHFTLRYCCVNLFNHKGRTYHGDPAPLLQLIQNIIRQHEPLVIHALHKNRDRQGYTQKRELSGLKLWIVNQRYAFMGVIN